MKLSDAQVKHMAERFLGWKLPETFNPDGGVVFRPEYMSPAGPRRHEPSGTNLFNFTQATEMVRHMAEGLPEDVG